MYEECHGKTVATAMSDHGLCSARVQPSAQQLLPSADSVCARICPSAEVIPSRTDCSGAATADQCRTALAVHSGYAHVRDDASHLAIGAVMGASGCVTTGAATPNQGAQIGLRGCAGVTGGRGVRRLAAG